MQLALICLCLRHGVQSDILTLQLIEEAAAFLKKAVSSNSEPKIGKSSRCASSTWRQLSSWLAREGVSLFLKRDSQAARAA